jgi:hypothetical protein
VTHRGCAARVHYPTAGDAHLRESILGRSRISWWESRSRVEALVEFFAPTIKDYDVQNAIWINLDPEFFLELKCTFLACPRCRHRDGWITPIRQGQLVCARSQCWTIVPWRNAEQRLTQEVVAIQSSREIIRDAHDQGVRWAHATEGVG